MFKIVFRLVIRNSKLDQHRFILLAVHQMIQVCWSATFCGELTPLGPQLTCYHLVRADPTAKPEAEVGVVLLHIGGIFNRKSPTDFPINNLYICLVQTQEEFFIKFFIRVVVGLGYHRINLCRCINQITSIPYICFILCNVKYKFKRLIKKFKQTLLQATYCTLSVFYTFIL